MLHKKKFFHKIKKGFTKVKKQRRFLSKRRRSMINNRLFLVGLSRLRRTQLRALRPMYCRVYARRYSTLTLYSSRFLVTRAVRCNYTRFLGARPVPQAPLAAASSLMQRVCFSHACSIIRGYSRRKLLRRKFMLDSRRGYRVKFMPFKHAGQQKGSHFYRCRTSRADRQSRRLFIRILHKNFVGIRSILAHNFSRRLSYISVAQRRALLPRYRLRVHREKCLRERRRRFRKQRYAR